MSESETPPITRAYRFAMFATSPVVRRWGRLEVSGLEHLPTGGPTLVAGNHDSYWDPVAIGIAGLPRRQIQALAKSELWKFPGLAPILDGMGQIPVDRGKGDVAAMDRALAELRAGACIGIFPEGTRSKGKELRPRAGIGRLAEAVPESEIVLASVIGTVDIPRFPKRPAVRVRFFRPEGGNYRPGEESHTEFSARLLEQIRREAPRVACGRGAEAAA